MLKWIYCDIDGSGEKWRLAVCREIDKPLNSTDMELPEDDMWFFPEEDFVDYKESYENCRQIDVIRPEMSNSF